MLLNQEHHHQGHSIIKKSSKKPPFDAKQETSKYFREQFNRSLLRLNKDFNLQIQKFREKCQNKVYATMESPTDYFSILLNERKQLAEKDVSIIQKAVHRKQKLVMKDLNSQNLVIQENIKSIQQIKQQLDQKLEVLRAKSADIEYTAQEDEETVKRKEEKKLKNYMEFRSRSYWKGQNQNRSQVLEFLKNIHRIQSQQKRQYEKDLQNSQQKIRKKDQRLLSLFEEKHKNEKEELHHRYLQDKLKRQKQAQFLKKKQQQAENLIMKCKSKNPAHILLPQKFSQFEKIQQRRRQQILKSLKQQKRHQSLLQIKQSLKEYDLQKISHAQYIEQKQRRENIQEQQLRQKLNEFYKSKIYALSKSLESNLPDQNKIRQQRLLKKIIYSKNIKKDHYPTIDQEKRRQLLQSIEQAKKKQNKIQKIRDGQLILIDKSQLNPRQKGLQYLQELKIMTSLIQRKSKETSTSPQIKLIDRSLMKKSFYSKKITISNWKSILANQKLTQEQKELELVKYLKMVEQQRVKAVKNIKKSDHSRSIEIQKQMDHYQVEKTQAKLALLKSLA